MSIRQAETQKELEEEGEVAADYIEGLLDVCDFDGDIDIDVRASRAHLAVTTSGDSLRQLEKPDVVMALQELTRVAVQNKTGLYSRVILEIGNSRGARRDELAHLVNRAAERLEAGAVEATLPPMSSYERKLIHDLAAEKGLTSFSRGEGSERHTVLQAAGSERPSE